MTTATAASPVSPADCQPPAVQPGQVHLRLAEHEVVIRKNGVEFLSNQPVPLWAEVSVDLHAPARPQPFSGQGVVVDCTGSPRTGYTISVLFLDLPLESRQHVHDLAVASAS